MNLLLDTHVFLWMLAAPDRIQGTVARHIQNPHHTVYISAITAVEIEIKRSLGKLKAPSRLSGQLENRGLLELPFRFAHGEALARLPDHHQDPFDRMLIAQALEEELTVVTHDRKFEPYPVPILWT